MSNLGAVSDYVNRKKNELSGLPEQPAGSQPTIQTSSVPMPTGTDAPAPKTIQTSAVPMPMSGDVPEQTPFRSQAGDNVASYINKTSANLSGDPGYTTEAGRLAAERVTSGLKTPDASSVNAQNTEDTMASRRAYLARVQADEAVGQSGFGAGTAQADRIRTNATAGVNSANQAGQNSVNAYLRQRTEDNLNRAQTMESTQYNKGRDNLGDAERLAGNLYNQNERATDRTLAAQAVQYGKDRDAIGDSRYNQTYADSRTDKATSNAQWDKLNAQQQAQLAIENATVAKNGTDTDKRNLLAGLPDGPAKNAVMAGLADGSLTVANALAKVMNADGTIKEEYRGKTPGALGLDAETEYAQQTVDLTDPGLKTSSPQDYLAKVNAEILKSRQAKTNPINDEANARDLKAIQAKIDTGANLTDTEVETAIKGGVISNVSSLKTKADINAQVGKLVTFGDGSTGKVLESGDNRGEAFMVLDVDGQKVEYMPSRAQFHIYSGGKDRWFASKDEAMAFLNGGK